MTAAILLSRVRMHAVSCADERGISVLDAMVAAAILAVGLVSLSQLMLVAARVARDAEQLTSASTLAGQKLEELRGVAFFDAADGVVSDERLAPSPADALERDTPGYVDYVDFRGNPLGAGADMRPADAAFVRRWSVTPVPERPADAVVIQVRVVPAPVQEPDQVRPSRAGEAWAATVRRRSQ